MSTEERSELIRIAAKLITVYQLPEDINDLTTYKIGKKCGRQIIRTAQLHNESLKEIAWEIRRLIDQSNKKIKL